MQNIPPELIITVKNHITITLFKMKGSPDLGQAEKSLFIFKLFYVMISTQSENFGENAIEI